MRKIVICSTAACSHLAPLLRPRASGGFCILDGWRGHGSSAKPHQVWEFRAKLYSMQNGTFTVKPLITHLPFFESAIHFMHG